MISRTLLACIAFFALAGCQRSASEESAAAAASNAGTMFPAQRPLEAGLPVAPLKVAPRVDAGPAPYIPGGKVVSEAVDGLGQAKSN